LMGYFHNNQLMLQYNIKKLLSANSP